jgi:hypothetical protein
VDTQNAQHPLGLGTAEGRRGAERTVLVYDRGKGAGEKEIHRGAKARRLAELLYTLMKNGTEYEARKFQGEKAPGAVGALAEEALAGQARLQRGAGAGRGEKL